MKHEIVGGASFPLVKIWLEKGESIKAESGAMLSMTGGLELTGKMDGGFGKALARMFTGESFFLQNITAVEAAGVAHLATPAPGEIVETTLEKSKALTVQKNGFLAATPGVEVSAKAQSITRGLLSGEGFFVVKLTGSGTVFLSAYGAIYPMDLAPGERVLINNGHLVAWESDMKYEITKAAASWFSALTSGAGFGCTFTGPGRVWVQTRNPYAFGVWAYPYLPIPRRQGR